MKNEQEETQKEFKEILNNLEPALAVLLDRIKNSPDTFEAFVGINLPKSLSGYVMKLAIRRDILKGD